MTPNNDRLHYSNFRYRVMVPAAEAIGRPEVTFHIRRQSTVAFLEQHLPALVVQAAMRHGSLATTFGSYAHFHSTIYEESAQAIDEGGPTCCPVSAPARPFGHLQQHRL